MKDNNQSFSKKSFEDEILDEDLLNSDLGGIDGDLNSADFGDRIGKILDELSELKRGMMSVNFAKSSILRGISNEELDALKKQHTALDGVGDAYEVNKLAPMDREYALLAREVKNLRHEVVSKNNEAIINQAHMNENVLNAIASLKEDVNSLRKEVEELKAVAGGNTALQKATSLEYALAHSKVLDEIELLRDQLFAIGAAKISVSGETANESYSSILVGELSAFRKEIAVVKGQLSDKNVKKVDPDLAGMKANIKMIATAVSKSDKADKALIKDFSDEISQVKSTLTEQKELNMSMISSIAKLHEIIELYGAPAKSSDDSKKILNEIEKIKDAIAATTSDAEAISSGDDIDDAIAKLKQEITEMSGVEDKPAAKKKPAPKKPPAQKAEETAKPEKPEKAAKPQKANASVVVQPEPEPESVRVADQSVMDEYVSQIGNDSDEIKDLLKDILNFDGI